MMMLMLINANFSKNYLLLNISLRIRSFFGGLISAWILYLKINQFFDFYNLKLHEGVIISIILRVYFFKEEANVVNKKIKQKIDL